LVDNRLSEGRCDSYRESLPVCVDEKSKQLLKRDISTFQSMQHHVAAWERNRNAKGISITWQFTREKAREKFGSGMGIKGMGY
jgi:hypothetical protein